MTISINQSINQFIKVMAWDCGCLKYPSQRLMYKTHGKSATKKNKVNK